MPQEFYNSLIITLIDKGALALILAFVGLWINKRLELFKSEQTRLNKLEEQTQALKHELQKQRDTRAFDKQLDWYERVIRALHDMAQKIEIASTAQEEGDDEEYLDEYWEDVQKAHLELSTLTDEAELYGSKKAVETTKNILNQVDEIADKTDVFDANFTKQNLELIDSLPNKLRKAAKPLAIEARKHLGLD